MTTASRSTRLLRTRALLSRQRRLLWLLPVAVLAAVGTLAFFISKNVGLSVHSPSGETPTQNPNPAARLVPGRTGDQERAAESSPSAAGGQRSGHSTAGHAPVVLPSGVVVCLDPGHPSENNSGRTVQNGLTELEVNWAVALKLRAYLEQAGVRVIMTKSTVDEYVTNRERAEIANGSGAALFYRIHADTGTHSGGTSYYPARPGQKDGVRGPSVAVSKASAVAAQIIHSQIAKAVCPPLRNNGVRTDRATYIGRRQGALTGSIFSQVPTVLTEMCVLSDKNDAEFIGSENGQWWMAWGMANGILGFLSRHDKSIAAPQTIQSEVETARKRAADSSTATGRAAGLSPPNGSELRGKVRVELRSPSDRRGAFATFHVDGRLISSTNVRPWGLEWDTAKVTDGWHVVRVEILDDHQRLVDTTEARYLVSNRVRVESEAGE